MRAHGWILPDQLLASGRDMSLAHPPHPELVLLCGGTEQQRARFRRAHSAAIDSRTAVTTSDVHSLLRWAPRSRAVIVCGELAGIGVATLERLVRERAPGVPVMDGDTSLNGNGKPANGRAAVSNGAAAIANGHLALA
jgi:hypothetical protein